MSLNLGSIADAVLETYELNDKISGNLISIANRARRSVENWTKQTIGSTSIDNKYEPVLVAQTALMGFTGEQTEGTDKNVRLGEFSISQGTNNSIVTQLKSDVREELKSLGTTAQANQTFYS